MKRYFFSRVPGHETMFFLSCPARETECFARSPCVNIPVFKIIVEFHAARRLLSMIRSIKERPAYPRPRSSLRSLRRVVHRRDELRSAARPLRGASCPYVATAKTAGHASIATAKNNAASVRCFGKRGKLSLRTASVYTQYSNHQQPGITHC